MTRERLPHVLGITGGIGSGKSVVSRCLRTMGIPVYDCDREARRLNVTHPAIRRELTALVGEQVYTADGQLNRPLLASYLFASPDHAARVNAIVHPRVREDFQAWCSRQGGEWVAVESAILYEAGFDDLADKVLAVHAPEAVRLQRVMARDGADEEAVRRRMACQMSDEEKCRRASHCLLNDGREAVIPQILDILGVLFCVSRG